MVAALVHTVQQHPNGWVHLALAGTFDENNGLDSYRLPDNCTWCVVDMAAIDRWNSTGVGDWLRWLQSHNKLGVMFVLVDVSVTTVSQLNMTARFQNMASVYSICLPYFCDACNLEQSTVMMVSELSGKERRIAPTLTCSSCGKDLVFDDIEETFFQFVATQRSPLDEDTIALRLHLARQGDMDAVNPNISSERIPYPVSRPPSDVDSGDGTESRSSTMDAFYYLSVGALVFLLALILYHAVNL